MAFDQFNVRLGNPLARRVRMRAAEQGIKPRDVLTEALVAHYGWPAHEPDPIDGQPAVDEAQESSEAVNAPAPASNGTGRPEEPRGSRGRSRPPAETSSPASRRPRAAKSAKRSKGTPPVDSPGDSSPPAGGDPAGCPECSADVEQGKCVDCGWLA